MYAIFLDIDGVLVNRASLAQASGSHSAADPECVRLLNELAQLTDADIVLSSTWRFNKDILDTLRKWGVRTGRVWKTPRLPGEIRGKEIAKFIENFGGLDGFVILDDDADMGELLPHLVQTSMETGLTREHCRQAFKVLTEGPNVG